MSSATSFTSSTPTFTPIAPAPTSPDSGGRGQSTSLYLYTFLATLVLLLSVSGAVVGRSMVLRRRRRAAILEAIANGTYVPPPPPVRPRDRPKMWEVYLDPEDKSGNDAEKGWADLRPVSALVVEDAGSEQWALRPEPALQAPGFLRRPFSLFRRARVVPAPPPSLVSPPQAPADDAQPPLLPHVPVQVAVLVAMPGRGSAAAHEELPVLEIGVGVVGGRVDGNAPAKEA